MSETVQIGFDGYQAFAPLGWVPPDTRAAPEVARILVRLASPAPGRSSPRACLFVAGHAGSVPQPRRGRQRPNPWQLVRCGRRRWGSGVAAAAALLGEAVAAAVAEGYGRMRLFTPRDQARARAFYEREGFAYTGWEALEESSAWCSSSTRASYRLKRPMRKRNGTDRRRGDACPARVRPRGAGRLERGREGRRAGHRPQQGALLLQGHRRRRARGRQPRRSAPAGARSPR